MVRKRKVEKSNQKSFAFLASFFTIIGFVVALLLWKDNKYVMFYAKQGLVLFLGHVLVIVLSPFLFFDWILWVFLVVLWVMTWINALSGKMKKTFVVGDIANKIKV